MKYVKSYEIISESSAPRENKELTIQALDQALAGDISQTVSTYRNLKAVSKQLSICANAHEGKFFWLVTDYSSETDVKFPIDEPEKAMACYNSIGTPEWQKEIRGKTNTKRFGV